MVWEFLDNDAYEQNNNDNTDIIYGYKQAINKIIKGQK